MKKIIGFTMIALLFIGVIIFTIIADGIVKASIIWGCIIALLAFIYLAYYLIGSE